MASDVDPRTAGYVRFFHEHFQKDRPDLLHQIKRATKTEQQTSKDDLDSLKEEVYKLKEGLAQATAEYNRKITELSYECNRRITSMNAEYDKLAVLVQHALGVVVTPNGTPVDSVNGNIEGASIRQTPVPVSSPHGPTVAASSAVQVPDLLKSLSQVAMSHLRQQGNAAVGLTQNGAVNERKRSATQLEDSCKKAKSS